MPTTRVRFNAEEWEKTTRERKSHFVRVANNSLSFVTQRVKGLTLRTSGVDFARLWARETFPWQLLAIFKVDVLVSVFTRRICRRRIENQHGRVKHVKYFQAINYTLFNKHNIYEAQIICHIIFYVNFKISDILNKFLNMYIFKCRSSLLAMDLSL